MCKLFAGLGFALIGAGAVLAACGGTATSSISQPGADSGADATNIGFPDSSVSVMDANTTDTGTTTSADTSTSTDAASSDSALPIDGGACGPPSNPTESALCVTLTPETIAFLADPKFDGKGTLVAQVFDTNEPSLPDGGTATALASVTYGGPDGGAPGGDLSMPLPVLRFDSLPATTVYVRVVFVDDPTPGAQLGPGYWLGGFDLSGGVDTDVLLSPIALSAGTGTATAIDLVALRAMTITLNDGVTPLGNGQGPAMVIATPSQMLGAMTAAFGSGQSACSKVTAAQGAEVDGVVIGAGPYYVLAVLEDFGAGNGNGLLPGTLASFEILDGGGIELPAANLMTYPSNAYKVSFSVTLNTVIGGDAGIDSVTCP